VSDLSNLNECVNLLDPTNLNSSTLCQNKLILRLLGYWRDEPRKDKDPNDLSSLRTGEEKQKALNPLMLFISNIKRGKHNIMCEINNGGWEK